MDESSHRPSAERLAELLDSGEHDDAIACLERFETAPTEERKAALDVLRRVESESPGVVGPLLPALSPFVTDGERSIRLTTAKLFVAVAERDPDAVVPVLPILTDRLADDDELYFVRARAAEALGNVALDHPDAVASPEVVAELQIGLSFDEPEVKEKLAKALADIALGDPDRLDHRVPNLAEHLDDGDELVRYYLCTAVAAVGCVSPRALGAEADALAARLNDENDHVRGRAAEAVGLLVRVDEGSSVPAEAMERLRERREDESSFVRDRARFALDAIGGGERESGDDGGEGTLSGLRATTDEAVEEMTAEDGTGVCPSCGHSLPDVGPPMCPRCGSPY
ncbi:HEAT repeat domain-containing protein (plasmid) [Haladaptatus sp. SPP-AMP-3]|uniref:HEAT repeat domain-containing protein n=1 Tax=Haladaptatus sp. SPP-AMP-3 TaxID=3121295 RepID=UPI003C30AC36